MNILKPGVCSGVFYSSCDSLKGGGKSCRCAVRFIWTKDQIEYRIEKIILEENLIYDYLGIVGGFKGSLSKLRLNCHDHGEFNSTVGCFIHGARCSACSKTGYNKAKPGSVYVLRISSDAGRFTGYGISNVIDKRLIDHKKNLIKHGFYIEETRIFSMSGQKAMYIETAIKRNFNLLRQDIDGFKKEATDYDSFCDVVNFVDQYSI